MRVASEQELPNPKDQKTKHKRDQQRSKKEKHTYGEKNKLMYTPQPDWFAPALGATHALGSARHGD